MKSIEKRTLESVIAGGVLFAVTFIQSIVLVPLFLQYWGGERYGVWLTLYGFVMLMRSLDAGHQTYVGNEFNKMFHIDKAKAQQILGSSVKVAFLLGGAELLIYLLIIFFGQHKRFVGFDLESYPVSTGIVAFLLMWLVVGSVGGILVRVILPMGAYAKSVYLNIGIKVTETVCIAVCVIINTSINTLSICIALCWLFYTLYLFAFVRKLMPDFYPWWSGGNWSVGLRNLSKSTAFTFSNFVEQFNLSGVLIVISNITGAANVSLFSTTRTVTNVFTQSTTIVLNPMVPDFIKLQVTGRFADLKELIKANWLVSSLAFNLPLMILTPFMTSLFEMWTRNTLRFDVSLFLTMAFGVALLNYGRALNTLITSVNDLKATMAMTLARFLIVAASAPALLWWLGISYVGWSFVLAELFSSVIFPIYRCFNNYVYKDLNLQIIDIVISLTSTVLLGLFFVLYCFVDSTLLLLPSILLLLLGVALQWTHISKDIKRRLLNLLSIAF